MINLEFLRSMNMRGSDPATLGRYKIVDKVGEESSYWANQLGLYEHNFFLNCGRLEEDNEDIHYLNFFNPAERKAETFVSKDFLDKMPAEAFEGLVWKEKCRNLLYSFACSIESSIPNSSSYNSINALDGLDKDIRIFRLLNTLFKKNTNLYAAYDSASGNVCFDEGHGWVVPFFESYLSALREENPETAALVLQGLEFRDLLVLDNRK